MSDDQKEWVPTLRRKRAIADDGTRIAYQVVGSGDRVLMFANGLGGRLYCDRARRRSFLEGLPHHHVGLPRSLRVGRSIVAASARRHASRRGRVDDPASREGRTRGAHRMEHGRAGHARSRGESSESRRRARAHQRHARARLLDGIPAALHRPVFPRATARDRRVLARASRRGTRARGRRRASPSGRRRCSRSSRRARARSSCARSYVVITQTCSDRASPTTLRLFQELDAHSAYHLLPEISAPTLVVSGALDFLTPAYQSRQIAARMPNAEHLQLARASHFALHERRDEVLRAMRTFLDERAQWAGASMNHLDGSA